MPGVSIYSNSPGLENKLGADSVIQKQRDLYDQMSLKASSERIKKVRAQYSAMPEEGKRITEAARANVEKLVNVGVERIKQLRTQIPHPFGQGKGARVNSQA